MRNAKPEKVMKTWVGGSGGGRNLPPVNNPVGPIKFVIRPSDLLFEILRVSPPPCQGSHPPFPNSEPANQIHEMQKRKTVNTNVQIDKSNANAKMQIDKCKIECDKRKCAMGKCENANRQMQI